MNLKREITEREELCEDVRNLVVKRLMLSIPAEYISNDQPLVSCAPQYGYTDTLSIAVAVNMEMGVTITDKDGTAIFSSINHIADFIERVREAAIL